MQRLTMELIVWESDFGLASFDVDCLTLMTYMRLSKIDFTVRVSRLPFLVGIPCLVVNNIKIYGFENIMGYLKAQVYDLDHHSLAIEHSYIYTYSKYLEAYLKPAVMATLWVDKQNYTELTRTWYRKALYFPFNIIYPAYMSNIMYNYTRAQIPNDDYFIQKLIAEGRNSLYVLSAKLGTNKFLLGNEPSSVDATLYGYLAPLLYVPFPSNVLSSFLKQKSNLVYYVQRMNTLFPEYKVREFKYVKQAKLEDSHELTTPTRTLLFAALFATTAMLSFGWSIGVLRMPSALE